MNDVKRRIKYYYMNYNSNVDNEFNYGDFYIATDMIDIGSMKEKLALKVGGDSGSFQISWMELTKEEFEFNSEKAKEKNT